MKVSAQATNADLTILSKVSFDQPEFNARKVHFMISKKSSPVIKYNPVFLFFGSLMYFYQAALSPQISAECRFTMSCSSFSRNAIGEFGLVKGISLSADRIMKCNRIAASGARPGEYNDQFKIFDTPSKYRINH